MYAIITSIKDWGIWHLVPIFKEILLRDCLVWAVAFLAAKWVIGYSRREQQRNVNAPSRPPPSPTRLPLLGNLLWMRRDMRKVFRSLSEKYGGLFALHIGPMKLLVVVSDMDAVKEAFLNQGDAFADRFIPPLLKYAVGVEGSFVFDNGDVWKARRRFGLGAMRSFGVGKTSMEHRIADEARILCESFENNQEVDFNPLSVVTNAVANVICSISFGSRYDYNDPIFSEVLSRIHIAVSSISFFSPGHILPALLHTPLYSVFRRLVYSVRSLVQGVVGDHRETLDEHDIRDIIDLYILEIRRQRESGERIVFDVERVWRGVFDLFMAGTGTTSATLLWAILLMAKFPEVMTKVQKEIDSVVGAHRLPTMSDQEAMPFTMATLMEIQRFRPVTPQGLPRFTNRDVVVLGYRIPKGTGVIMPLWTILHAPKYWEEPLVFNPSRFLSKDGQSVQKPEAFIPFGIGNRVCMGELLAKMELFLFFTTLLQRFSFRLADDSHGVGLDGQAGILLVPPDFRVRVRTR